MSERTLLITARDAVHNFTRYAELVDAGAEVIITRRGRASLKLVRVEPLANKQSRQALVEQALAIRTAKPFVGKFARSEAYDQ